MSLTLTICQTCNQSQNRASDPNQQTDGQRLIQDVMALALHRQQSVRIVPQACLWACRRACTILIQEEGKFGYLAGDFLPHPSAAEAILDWCAKMEGTQDGVIAFKNWPAGMKGRFIARIPPLLSPKDSQKEGNA
jgi:predicted metal-binding protein